MKKRAFLKWAALGAGAALGAKGYMEYYRPGGLPGQAELEPYFDGLFEMMGLPGLRERIEEDWIVNDGNRLHLDLFLSRPGDPALVFFPGTSVYALFYAEFMHKMRLMGFNVIGVDPRGHGRSEGRRGSYTIMELVSDARATIDYALERFESPVALAGSSQGGIIAFYTAALDARLSAVVCHNIAELGRPEALRISRFPRLMPYVARLLPLADLVPDLRLPVTLYLDLKAEETKFGRNAMEFVKADPLVVLALPMRALASLASTPPPRPVEEIEVPVMVIQAECDNLFSNEYTRSIYDRLTCDKEFLLVTKAPHLLLTNDVDVIVPEVAAWLGTRMRKGGPNA